MSGFSSIRRCPPYTAQDGARRPVIFDDDDPLCLDGERLILATGTHLQPGAVYVLRHDRNWKVQLVDDAGDGDGYFLVYLDNGRVRYYGRTSRERRYLGAVNYEWALSYERV